MVDDKLKIIFLDIDGVLNGYNVPLMISYKLADKFHKLYWIKQKYPIFGIHESKVKILAKIVKETGAVCVLSSSWRDRYFKSFENGNPFLDIHYNAQENKNVSKLKWIFNSDNDIAKLKYLLDKYNIKIIDKTCHKESRELEIYQWISENEDRIFSFVILDDEVSEFNLLKDRLVQTSSIKENEIIKGNVYENAGLKRKHVKKAINILKENIRK